MKLRVFVIAIAAGLSVVLASCDFTNVEEASQTPIDDVLGQVDQADTPAEAKKAIRTLLRKAEVGIDWKDGAYSSFKLTDDEIDRLATVHADYVSGKGARSATFEEVYQGLLEADRTFSELEHWTGSQTPITASLEDVMTAFSAALSNALAHPESPESALLLAIAGDAASVLTDTAAAGKTGAANRHLKLATTYSLSPFQQILFALWFSKHGHGCDIDSSKDCPDGYTLVAKFEYQNGWVFEKPSGHEGVITINGNARNATWTLNNSDYTVDLVRIKAGTFTEAFPVPNQAGGELEELCGWEKHKHGDKYKCHDMSNVLFCELDKPDCSEICHTVFLFKYWYYRCIQGKSEEKALQLAKEKYEECNASCHNQGSGSGG